MAEHRIRRWVQFGVLDLLVLTTIAAVVVVLCRPPRIETYYEPLAEGTTPGQHWAGNGLRMKFRWCPPGEFKMGESPNQVDVKLTRGFWLGKYEVTQGQYRQVMNNNPSEFPARAYDYWTSVPAGASLAQVDADRLPVESMTWADTVAFCRGLTEQERKAGRLPTDWVYRLPTDAQWEYACRAGSQTTYSFGDDEKRLPDFAWYYQNSAGQTHEVGQKLPNAWGLYDMHGNVHEWCSDACYSDALRGGIDPEATDPGHSFHVVRSGCWANGHDAYAGTKCRSALRIARSPTGTVGFRVALMQSR